MPSSPEAATQMGVVRAVAAGEFWRGSTTADLVESFRSIGWDVAQVEAQTFFTNASHVATRVFDRLAKPLHVASYNSAILSKCRDVNPQVFFTVKGYGITTKSLQWMGTAGTFRVMFFPDFNFDQKGLDTSLFKHFDLFITTKSFQVDYIKSKFNPGEVIYMPHVYSQDVADFAKEFSEDETLWDVSYVGNASDYKFDLLLQIKRAMPELSMLIIGNGWKARAAGTPLEQAVTGFPLTADLYARVVARSKICIAMHMGVAGSLGWQDLVSRRTFELPAYHGFMLHIDNHEVRELYDVPAEIDVFTDATDLIDKIRLYLPQPALRRLMKVAARDRAAHHYSSERRAAAIDTLVRERLASRRAQVV